MKKLTLLLFVVFTFSCSSSDEDRPITLTDGKIQLNDKSKPLTESKNLIIMSNKRFTKSSKKGKKSYRNYKRK